MVGPRREDGEARGEASTRRAAACWTERVATQGDDLGERKPAEQKYNDHDLTTYYRAEKSKDFRTVR